MVNGGKNNVTKFLNRFGKYFFIDKDDVNLAFDLFQKHGNKIVLFGRLIPIVRTIISFPAGVAEMHFGIFTAFTLLGSFVWNIILVYAGYILADNWGIVGQYINKYENGILVIGAILLIFYFVRGYIKKKNSK